MGDLSEIFEAWTTRIRSPLFGYYSLAFTAINWREILYLAMSDTDIQERINFFDQNTGIESLFCFPIAFAVLASLLYPWVQLGLIRATSFPNIKRNIVNAKAESDLLAEKVRLEENRNKIRLNMEQDAINRAKTEENLEDIKDDAARKRARDEINAIRSSAQLLHQKVSKKTIQEYLSTRYPDKPQNDKLLGTLFRDLNKEKYQTIGDFSKVLSEAAPFLEHYSSRHPSIFSYSTDYLTKALGFVDPDFRASHRFSQETLNAIKEFRDE